MKKSFKFLGKLASLASLVALFALGSCNSDDSDDDLIDDVINEGPSLNDGYYIVGSAVSSDTTDANLLIQGKVNAPSYGSQDRPGFYEAYIYMGTGSFSFVKVEGEEVTELGGSFEETLDGDPAEITIYVGAYSEGGAAATSPVEGSLVHVSIDETTGQYVVVPVDYWEIIGDATETGWGAGKEIAQTSASAEKVVFEGTDIVLRSGFYKFRFNSNWSMNLEEGDCDAGATACYNYFTNFGGSINELVHGGGNITFDGTDGVYTVTVTYEPGKGNSISAKLERTGDAPEITFDPAEHPWSIRGTSVGSPDDWSEGPLLTANHEGSTYRWYGVIELSEGAFKVTDGGTWLGNGGVTDNTGVLTGDDDLLISANDAGFYYFTVITSDDGANYTATIDKASFGLIGSATAAVTGGDGWGSDADMTESGSSFTINIDLEPGDIKFRANDAWEYNLGGDLAGLSHNGDNIAISTAGNYTITIATVDKGESYTATIE